MVSRNLRWVKSRNAGRAGSQAGVSRTEMIAAATVDELIPGRSRSRVFAIESERTRLAGDLHAEVLPELAHVIRLADAGTGGSNAAKVAAPR